MATIFRDPLISTPRSPPRPGPTIASAGLCCLLAVAGAKPFVQNDWPLPKCAVYPTQNRTYLHPAQTRLIGQDTFFGTKGLSPTYDWPLPKVKPYPIDNRTWLQSYDWGNLGKDKFFQGPGQAPRYDWPLPTVTRWYSGAFKQGEVSGRALGPGAKPFVQSDWPLPEVAPYPVQNRSGATGRVLAQIYPFVQSDWPLPVAEQQGRGWTYSQQITSAVAVPFNQTDWPLPTQLSYSSKTQGWTWQQQLDQPPFGTAWPAPPLKPYRAIEVGQNLLALYQVQAPFTQLEWPTPRTTKQAPQDVPQNYLVGLAPQGLAPFTPQDWPLPRKSPFVLGVTSGRAIGTTAVQNPFAQFDWPTPQRAGLAARTWTWSTLLPPLGQIALPFAQTDWPLANKTYFVQAEISGRVIGTTVVATPFVQQDWPLPGRQPFSLPYWYTVRYESEPGPFGQLDWPNPKSAPYPISNRTWLKTYDWGNLGQDRLPFSQDDWLLPRVIEFTQADITGVTLLLPAPPAPIAQYDWPLSRIAVYSAQTRTWTFVPIEIPSAIIVPPTPELGGGAGGGSKLLGQEQPQDQAAAAPWKPPQWVLDRLDQEQQERLRQELERRQAAGEPLPSFLPVIKTDDLVSPQLWEGADKLSAEVLAAIVKRQPIELPGALNDDEEVILLFLMDL